MLYNGDIAYDQAHFNYDGVYVVSPQSFGLTSNFGGLNVLGVIVISPPSVDSTLVFAGSHSVITPSGITDNTETSSYMTFAMLLAIEFGLNNIGLKRIWAITTKQNEKAIKLIEKLNFIKIADLDDNEVEFELRQELNLTD